MRSASTVEEAWPLPAVVVAYHVTYDGHPDAYPLHITSKILSDGQSGRITRELIYNKRLALSAFARGNITEDPNLFYAVAIVQPGVSPATVEKALIDEFEKLKTTGVTARELERAKNQFARDYIVGRESNEQKALHLAHAAVIHNDVTTADGEFDIFVNTTTGRRPARGAGPTSPTPTASCSTSCRRAAAEDRGERSGLRAPAPDGFRLRASLWALGLGLWASSLGTSVASAQVANWPSERPPRPLQAREVKFPPYEVRTLANGMPVVVVLHHEQPAVSMRLLVRAGRGAGPRGQDRRREPGGLAPRPGHDDAGRRQRSPIRSTPSAARSAPARPTT